MIVQAYRVLFLVVPLVSTPLSDASRRTDEPLVERVVADMSAAPPEVALPAGEAALTYASEVTVALEELNLPVAAINADDPPTDIESMERYGVDFTLMSGVGNFLMMEDPQRFNTLLRDVVGELLR